MISVPKRLRGFLADRPAAVAALTRIFIEEIERLLGAAAGVTSDACAPAAARPRLGAVSFLHRFGSALNHHVHLHVCATDGVFVPAADGAGCDASPAFLPARPINQADLAALTDRVRRRVIRWFRLTRLRDTAAAAAEASAQVSRGVCTQPQAQAGRDGAGDREHRQAARGCDRWACGRRSRQRGCCDANPNQKPRSHDTSRLAWAKLMARVGEEFPLACPTCGGDIRLIAFITEPGPIRKILTHLGEPLEPPPGSPARGPPIDWGELVQVRDDRASFQGRIDDLPVIDIHSL